MVVGFDVDSRLKLVQTEVDTRIKRSRIEVGRVSKLGTPVVQSRSFRGRNVGETKSSPGSFEVESMLKYGQIDVHGGPTEDGKE